MDYHADNNVIKGAVTQMNVTAPLFSAKKAEFEQPVKLNQNPHICIFKNGKRGSSGIGNTLRLLSSYR